VFSDRFQKLLDKCISSSAFGEPAVYLSKEVGSDPVDIRGIPSRETIEMILGQSSPGLTRKTTFGINAASLQADGVVPKEGDSLTLRSIQFKIKGVSYDGEGGAVLTLLKS
jgi:hypothetical protein